MIKNGQSEQSGQNMPESGGEPRRNMWAWGEGEVEGAVRKARRRRRRMTLDVSVLQQVRRSIYH